MRIQDVLKQLTMPLTAPAYPRGPYYFHNREYLNIVYRTDMQILREVVPEPLVRFKIMRMPDTTGLGSYAESGQVIRVRLGSECGEIQSMRRIRQIPPGIGVTWDLDIAGTLLVSWPPQPSPT